MITLPSTGVVLSNDVSGDIDPDGDGTALINYYLIYPEARSVNVAIEFSSDNGTTFSTCTEQTALEIGGQSNPTEGLNGLAAGPGGVEHWFAWDTDAPGNLPGQNLNWLLVRITVLGGDDAVSGYLTLVNDQSDSTAPQVNALTATAVAGPSNDTLVIVYSKGVDAAEAVDLGHYTVQNPTGTFRAMGGGSTASYDPVAMTVTVTCSTPNLQHGEECVVTVADVHDLAGNAVEFGVGDEATDLVEGDGDDVPADQPTLMVAWFDGSPTPQAGEFLYLRFDEEIALDSGAVFDNNDVIFWNPGNTIGTSSPVTVALYDSRTAVITLGNSPAFSVNSSRINLPAANDVITDLAGNVPEFPASPLFGDYKLVINEDATPPEFDLFTLNRIPGVLNGTGPAGGGLLVPRTGFDLYLSYSDSGGSGVDPVAFEIMNDREVTSGGATVAAGANLADYLDLVSVDTVRATFNVPADMTFPDGTNTLSANVFDYMGNSSVQRTFTFQVTAVSNYFRPFETVVNASQVWNLIFDRDLYTITMTGGASVTVNAVSGGNGIADFDEDLKLFGLACDAPIPVPGTGLDSNQFMRAQVIEAVKDELSNVVFAGVNITFTDSNQGGLPGNNPQVAYSSFSHSQIAIGGDSDVGALGVAFVDRANRYQDNDVLYNGSSPYNPGVHLGVFTTRVYKFEVNGSTFGLFRLTYDDFISGRGTPVGAGASDQEILMDLAGTGPSVTNGKAARRDDIVLGIQRLARFISVVGAHEMGHSMGLSVTGASPSGLYGGDPTHFPGSDSNHLNLTAFPDLFMVPNVNIMVPATNFWYCNAAGTRFNYLNKAYLQEKAYYYP